MTPDDISRIASAIAATCQLNVDLLAASVHDLLIADGTGARVDVVDGVLRVTGPPGAGMIPINSNETSGMSLKLAALHVAAIATKNQRDTQDMASRYY